MGVKLDENILKSVDSLSDLKGISPITKDVYLNYINKNSNSLDLLTGIPTNLIPYKLIKLFFECHKEVKNIIEYVPKDILSKDVYNLYFEITKNVNKIPEELLNQKMCDECFEKYLDFSLIPLDFISDDMIYKFIDMNHTLLEIPMNCLTKEICMDYYNKTFSVKGIPVEYLTSDMIYKYIDTFHSIEGIPDEALDKKICDYYFNLFNELDDIPYEYVTDDMIYRHIDRYKTIKRIPIELLNQSICDEYYNEFHSTDGIPDEFLNDNMHKTFSRGFTLIELLGVIVILGIIGLIIVPIVQNTILDSSKDACRQMVNSFERAAQNYVSNNPYNFCNDGDTTLELDELKEKGYLEQKDLKNPSKGSDFSGHVIVSCTKIEGNYKFSYKYSEDDPCN